MEGVEVLNEIVVYDTAVNVVPGVIVAVFIGILGFVVGGLTDPTKKFSFGNAFILGAILFCCGIMLVISVVKGLCTYTTDTVLYIEQRVTISDEVKFNEFNDMYEILEQDGKIYTVRVRE